MQNIENHANNLNNTNNAKQCKQCKSMQTMWTMEAMQNNVTIKWRHTFEIGVYLHVYWSYAVPLVSVYLNAKQIQIVMNSSPHIWRCHVCSFSLAMKDKPIKIFMGNFPPASDVVLIFVQQMSLLNSLTTDF